MAIEDWIDEADLYDGSDGRSYSINVRKFLRETPKAYLVQRAGVERWLPKSQVELFNVGGGWTNITVPWWLAEKTKELNWKEDY